MAYVDYSDKATSLEKWIDEIAPKYFDFDASELYRASQFGYINEIMSTVENDTHHAVSIARREFYPTTAKYLKSFYKMGALQRISYPMANPAVATAVLVIKEADIIKYGVPKDNISTGRSVYEFVLDNSMKIMAGNIPFMLDYPIIITAQRTTTIDLKPPKGVNSNTLSQITTSEFAYTVRYDTINKENSLNDTKIKYLKTRVYKHAGEVLLLIKVGVRQCQVQSVSAVINKSPILNNITLDFPFTGEICNFEVYYTPNASEYDEQLTKLPLNASAIKNQKFCMYSMVDTNTLRITFPENKYFNPAFNSSVRVDIYTTLGDNGNFASYDGPVVCQCASSKYPYNNMVTITGKITGSSIDGYSLPTIDDFRADVIAAYATNKTYTTDQDLQIMFDSKILDTRNKILFRKRRDDVFERLYGAYMLIKDLSGHVIPTNSLMGEITGVSVLDHVNNSIVGDFDRVNSITESGIDAIIKPGRVWKYHGKSVIIPVQIFDGTKYEFITSENDIYEDSKEKYVSLRNEFGAEVFNHLYATIFENQDPDSGKHVTLFSLLQEAYGNMTISSLEKFYGDEIYAYLASKCGGFPNLALLAETERTPGSTKYVTTSVFTDGRNEFKENVAGENREYVIYPTDKLVSEVEESLDYEEFQYATPFLMRVNTHNGVTAYYQNTFNTTLPGDTLAVNNDSIIQFSMNDFTLTRNAVAGENFYKLSVSLQTSISESILSQNLLRRVDEYITDSDAIAGQTNFNTEINAQYDGYVVKFVYVPGDVTSTNQHQYRDPGCVYMIIRYTDNITESQITKYADGKDIEAYLPDDKCIAIRISGGVKLVQEGGIGRSSFYYKPEYKTTLLPGDRFTANSVIATAKPLDTGVMRVFGQLVEPAERAGESDTIISKYYIPFTLDEHIEDNDVYVFSAYISTNDEISSTDKLVIDDGLCDIDGNNVSNTTIKAAGLKLRISTFIAYDDVNQPISSLSINNGRNEVYSYDQAYVKGYTLTNVYQTSETFDLLTSYNFIRSIYSTGYTAQESTERSSWFITLSEIPVVRAGWLKHTGNVYDLFRLLRYNYDHLYEIYDLLENNFSIDMKFYNTYGKSRYYMIGMKNSKLLQLENTCVKIKLGVRVHYLTDWDDFKTRLTDYIQGYVESFNNIENAGKSIFIMDLITDINNKFDDEIEYLEYYGINDFDSNTAQVIESWPIDKIEALGYKQYVPEFINLFNECIDTRYVPAIELTAITD